MADLYLGYALSERLRRTPVPPPPEPCPLPLAAVAVRDAPATDVPARDVPTRDMTGGVPKTCANWTVGADVGGRRLRRGGRGGPDAIERGDVYQVNLVQHLSASFDGDPRALVPILAPLRPLAPFRAGDGWAVVSASPELFLGRRGRRVWTMPIKGTRPLGEHVEGGEGRGRARDDRRPRAKRSLAGLRARVGALAGADGRARARGRHAPRVHGRGDAARRRGPRRPARGHIPRRLRDGRAKIAALDQIARLEPVGRGASMGALGTVGGNGDLELALTIRTFAVAEGHIHLWVGGGIVWDSEPDAEVEESWTKARPLLERDRSPAGGAESEPDARCRGRRPRGRRSRRAGAPRRRRGTRTRPGGVRDAAGLRRALFRLA